MCLNRAHKRVNTHTHTCGMSLLGSQEHCAGSPCPGQAGFDTSHPSYTHAGVPVSRGTAPEQTCSAAHSLPPCQGPASRCVCNPLDTAAICTLTHPCWLSLRHSPERTQDACQQRDSPGPQRLPQSDRPHRLPWARPHSVLCAYVLRLLDPW